MSVDYGLLLTAEEVARRSVPATVTKLQLVRALRAAGLWTSVQALLSQAPATVQEDWEFAHLMPRDDALLAQFAAALELTEAQQAALFEAAAGF